MSARRQLREIERERQELLQREAKLHSELKWQFGYLVLFGQLADGLLSFLIRFGGRRRKGRARRR